MMSPALTIRRMLMMRSARKPIAGPSNRPAKVKMNRPAPKARRGQPNSSPSGKTQMPMESGTVSVANIITSPASKTSY